MASMLRSLRGAKRSKLLIAVLSAASLPFVLLLLPAWKAEEAGRADHRKVQAILDELVRNGQRAQVGTEKTYTIAEPELNRYLAHQIAAERPPGIKSASVSLGDNNRVAAILLINMDELKSEDESFTLKMAKLIMSGEQRVDVEGALRSDGGKGTFSLERVAINGTELPSFLATEVARAIGKRQEPPVDITRPFDLPHNIRKIEISRGQLKIIQWGSAKGAEGRSGK